MDVSANLLDLFNTKDVIFCTYKQLGFLCFDGKRLFLVSVLPSQSSPVFVKTSTISFQQAPPTLTEVAELSVSPNGQFVALLGERCIYIAELSQDLWNTQSLFVSVCLSNLKQNYSVVCEILNVNLVLGKRASSVRKAVWLEDRDSSKLSNILGVLYSNSVVRIYDINVSRSTPIALADFQHVLSGYDPQESYKSTQGKQFGLISEIVSFDFGPVLEYNGNIYYTVFTVDSDGEIYYNVSSKRAKGSLDPIGPLKLEGMDEKQKSFFFNSTEIHFVNCPEVPDLFVFAFCSEQGELFHTLLSLVGPLNALFEEGKNVYRLTVMDSMQIEDWPLNNTNLVIRNNTDSPGEYFIVTSTEVYLINPSPWLQALDSALNNSETEFSFNNTQLPTSDVRHFFKILGASSETTIVSIASLRIENDSVNEISNMSVFAVLDSTPRVSANFIQRRLEGDNNVYKTIDRQLLQSSKLTSTFRSNFKAPTFTSMPKLSTADLDHAQRLKTMSQALATIDGQTKQLQLSVTNARQKTEQMIQRYVVMDQAYEQYCDRLVKIFESLHQHKREMTKLRETLPQIENKYNLIVSMMQSRVYAPSDKEDEAVEKLKDVISQSEQRRESVRELNAKIAAKYDRRRVKPFQASTSAQRFMLSKNGVEIAHLNEYILKLKNEFNKLMS